MCFGGNSAKTDRKTTLEGYGDLRGIIDQLNKTGSGLTKSGGADTGKASKYFSDIVSGDPTKVIAAAAPEAHAIQSGITQQKKQLANLGGNRTGGTNAVTQTLESQGRGKLADVIAKQRGGSAENLAEIGARETAAGVGATEGAGTNASSLTALSADSRKTSQQMHDAAVDQWVTVAADLLLA